MNILDLVITVLIIVASVLLSIRKKKRSSTSYEPYNNGENFEWDGSIEEPHLETILQKTAKSVSNPFIYDNIGKVENIEKKTRKNEIIYPQNFELEIETDKQFLISQEEIRKAVIYSEILKRPHFK